MTRYIFWLHIREQDERINYINSDDKQINVDNKYIRTNIELPEKQKTNLTQSQCWDPEHVDSRVRCLPLRHKGLTMPLHHTSIPVHWYGDQGTAINENSKGL